MKGKAKIQRKDGLYYVYTKKHFWNRWKPLKNVKYENYMTFKTFEDFCNMIQVERFDIIEIKLRKLAEL